MMKILNLLLVAFLCSACAARQPQHQEGELVTEGGSWVPFVDKVSSAISPEMYQSRPEIVAILPVFPDPKVKAVISEWQDVDPLQIFRTVFFGRFSVLPFKDLPLKQTDQILNQQGLLDLAKLEQLSSSDIGDLLKVDALIYIQLSKAENVTAGIHSRTEYAATLKMIDVLSGQELWRAELKETNLGGVLSRKGSQLGELIDFEKENKDRPLAFRKVAERWSYKVIRDFREKWGAHE